MRGSSLLLLVFGCGRVAFDAQAPSSSADAGDAVADGSSDATMSDLGGWWRLDEAFGTVAADSSGNGNVGAVSLVSSVGGMVNGAGSFTANNSVVDVGHGPSISPTGSATWTAWVYPTALTGADEEIVSKQTFASNSFQFKITSDCDPDTIGLLIESGSTFGQRCGSTNLPINTWSFVAGVFDANAPSITVYFNGALDDGGLVGTIPSGILASTVNVAIGNTADTMYPFTGRIDDVRMYNRALGAAEIQQIYLGN